MTDFEGNPGTKSQVIVKTSLFSDPSRVWLPITLGLLVIAGIIGTIGVTVVTVLARATTTISTGKVFIHSNDH